MYSSEDWQTRIPSSGTDLLNTHWSGSKFVSLIHLLLIWLMLAVGSVIGPPPNPSFIPKGLTYVNIGQKIKLDVGKRTGSPHGYSEPKRILIGTWYRIKCPTDKFVSIPTVSSEGSQKQSYDMRKPLRYAEYHSSEQRVAPCDQWFGVSYSYQLDGNGRPGNDPLFVYQLGRFFERNSRQVAFHLGKPNVTNQI